jgi:hypothetical protein
MNSVPPVPADKAYADLMTAVADFTGDKQSRESMKKSAQDTYDKHAFMITNSDQRLGYPVSSLFLSKCFSCKQIAIWLKGNLIYPPARAGEQPHHDMPADIRSDFEEARSIVNLSPRGAAMLLRLCVQKLCIELGQKGENINHDIGELVKDGLPEEIRVALDSVRVIGNLSVHPGELDMRDDKKTVLALFKIINFIIEKKISTPLELQKIYEMLPTPQRQGIENRDKRSIKLEK